MRSPNLQLESLLIIMFTPLAVWSQHCAHASSLQLVTPLRGNCHSPSYRQGNAGGQRRAETQPRPPASHWAARADTARSQTPARTSGLTRLSLKAAPWPGSCWFLIEQQLSARQGRHSGPEVRTPGSLELPVSFSPTTCSPLWSGDNNYMSSLPRGERSDSSLEVMVM